MLLSFTALAPAAAGHVRTASLNGTVIDGSKAVLPGATVTATEAATGRPSQAVTDERGEFHLLSLSPGIYRVQAELRGFATVTNENVALLVGQNGTDEDLPPAPAFAAGWHYGEPEYVIEMMQDYLVPAEGEMPNLRFYAPVPFKDDRFVRLIEWQPGDRIVVHHGNAAVGDLPAGSRIDPTPGKGGELILADGTRENDSAQQRRVHGEERAQFAPLLDWVPGRYGFPVPSPDVGFRIPAGKHIRFGTHYQASGKPTLDRWDEMFLPFIAYTVDREDPAAAPKGARP